MLDIMRKHAGSWLIKILLGLVIVVFILWGGYAARSRQENSVAKVGDKFISMSQFNNAYQSLTDMYRKQFGKAFSEEAMKGLNLKQQALDALITRHVLIMSAEQLGFAATPEEVQRKILEVPAFRNGGRFDQERYQAVLLNNRLTPEQFERQTWEELTIARTESFIKGRTSVSDDEVMTDYHFNNDRIRLIYALVEPKTFEDKVKADDEALQTFYKGNQNRYLEPEKRRVSYVLFNAAEAAKTETVTEEESRRYYEDFQK